MRIEPTGMGVRDLRTSEGQPLGMVGPQGGGAVFRSSLWKDSEKRSVLYRGEIRRFSEWDLKKVDRSRKGNATLEFPVKIGILVTSPLSSTHHNILLVKENACFTSQRFKSGRTSPRNTQCNLLFIIKRYFALSKWFPSPWQGHTRNSAPKPITWRKIAPLIAVAIDQ